MRSIPELTQAARRRLGRIEFSNLGSERGQRRKTQAETRLAVLESLSREASHA